MKDPSRKEPFRRSRLTEERRSTRASMTRPTLFGGDARSPLAASPAGQRIRIFRIAGGIAALLALGVLGLVLLRTWSVPPAPPAPVAVLEIAHGPVTTLAASTGQDHSRLLALGAGEPIYAGAVIETRAAPDRTVSGPAALRLAGGPSLRLDADSRVRIPSSSVVELERGAVYVDFAGAGSDVEVRTTLGVARALGTQFEVRLLSDAASEGELLRVRVREGTVILERGGESHEASAGVELVMRDDGTLTRGSCPIYGPHWAWVLAIAPVPDIEGRPLRVFLDWVIREGGWKVRFADQETAALASTIILHGDAKNLTPEEAATMVLRSSGLDYRLEEDTFFVGPKGSAEALR